MPSKEELFLRSEEARGNKELLRYLMTLGPFDRADYLAGRREALGGAPDRNPNNNRIDAPPPAKPKDAQEAPQQAIRRPFNMQSYSGANPVQQGFINDFGPAAQGRHLRGIVDDVQDAIQDENDSRVAQMREQRRMAHEREMEAMRQEALLERLAMEQREREKDRILQRQLQTGVTSKRLVNGRWEYV